MSNSKIAPNNDYPAAFAGYADGTTDGKGVFRDKGKLWAYILQYEPELAAAIRKQNNPKGDLSNKLLDRVRAARQAMTHAGSVKAGRATSAPPSSTRTSRSARPNGATPQAAKGVPQLHEMKFICSTFLGPADVEAPLADIKEYAIEKVAWYTGSRNVTAALLFAYMNVSGEGHSSIVVCKAASFANESTESIKKLVERYGMKQFTFSFDNNGALVEVPCVVFQFGSIPLRIMTCEDSKPVIVSTPAAKYTMISIQWPNLHKAKDFEAKARSSFPKEVLLTVGMDNVHPDGVPAVTDFLLQCPFRKDRVDIIIGKVLVRTDRLQAIWDRCGIGDIFPRP